MEPRKKVEIDLHLWLLKSCLREKNACVKSGGLASAEVTQETKKKKVAASCC